MSWLPTVGTRKCCCSECSVRKDGSGNGSADAFSHRQSRCRTDFLSRSGLPLNYTHTASAAAWTQLSYEGTEAIATASGFFVAYEKVLVDMNGDLKVDILDVAQVAYAFGSRVGDTHWNVAFPPPPADVVIR